MTKTRFFGTIMTGAALCAALFFAPPAQAEMERQPVAKLRTLDKITARTMTFEANVGDTVKFGPLFIKIRSCYKAPPIEQPEAASFLQIWENSLKDGTPQWVFSGWMFASSPALSPMDHAVYDVWVLDCLPAKTGTAPATESEVSADDAAAADADSAPPAAAAQNPPLTPIADEDIVEEEAPPSPDDDLRTQDETEGDEDDSFPLPFDMPE